MKAAPTRPPSNAAISKAATQSSREHNRLDIAVAKLAGTSRERAQGLILAGRVKVDGEVQRKAGFAVRDASLVDVENESRYASRGGYKLERALETFRWSPSGLRCLDVGASTGGFTDCLLRHGAQSVVTVDVGYGLLAWSLRQDPRVTVVERCNFRHADLKALGAPFAFACADVSFISLTKLAAQFANALTESGRLIVLVKPQFEAGRQAVKRGGVVRDPSAQAGAIQNVVDAFANVGLRSCKLTYSPMKGPAGNIEFLLGAVCGALDQSELDVAGVVREAHEALAR